MNNPLSLVDPNGMETMGKGPMTKEEKKKARKKWSAEQRAAGDERYAAANQAWVDNGFRTSSTLSSGGGRKKSSSTLVKTKSTPANSNNCDTCLNESSTGRNLWWASFVGPWNPVTNDGDPSYSFWPTNPIDFPAIGHDRRYGNLKIAGLLGLFFSGKAISTDAQFVWEEIKLVLGFITYTDDYTDYVGLFSSEVSLIERVQAAVTGVGLGLIALPKTVVGAVVGTVRWALGGESPGANFRRNKAIANRGGVNNIPSPKVVVPQAIIINSN